VSKVTITELKLTNFRNHKNFTAHFDDGVTLIVGPNGAGKTNILEAINLLSTGKSIKARYDHEMVYNPTIVGRTSEVGDVFDGSLNTKEFAKVAGLVQHASDEDSIEITIVRENPDTNFSQKSYKLNGTAKRIYETDGFFNVVLFTPQDLELFTGSPALRRRFLDETLYKVDQRYKKEHMLYTKALRQRNKVLEKINKTSRGREELPFWTEKIVISGTYIQQQRAELIETLNATLGETFSNISAKPTSVDISYNINELTLERLEKHRDHEIYAKTTLVGPHRDDFDVLLAGFNISHFGSRGQQRTAVLSLKISELDIVNAHAKSHPTLLLDDIFSELDEEHKKALASVIQNQQTIITSTHSDMTAQNTISL
jgi:DNA replication and repair protein RecF